MFTSLSAYLRGSWRILAKEIAAFGMIGIIALAIDLSVYNLLFSHHIGVLTSKLISTVVATTFAYFGNRYLSFSHRARTTLGRETTYFFAINGITLVISELILAIFAYPLGLKFHQVEMNIVNLFTIGLGTVFRFWAYKRFVFLHPDRVAHGLPDEDEEEEYVSAS